MSIHYKSILIACFIALPSFSSAAENPVEVKPAVTAPAEMAVTPVATIQSARIGSVDIVRIGSESERGKTVKSLLTAKKNALQEKETKALYEAIGQSAVAHGKANGFAAIVVKKELLYISSSADTKDVTDDLIKALNQTDQKK